MLLERGSAGQGTLNVLAGGYESTGMLQNQSRSAEGFLQGRKNVCKPFMHPQIPYSWVLSLCWRLSMTFTLSKWFFIFLFLFFWLVDLGFVLFGMVVLVFFFCFSEF